MKKSDIKILIESVVTGMLNEWEKEELRLQGEQEAMNEMEDWMFIQNPHGTTKQEFVRFLNQDLKPKYGREAVMMAFDALKKEKGCLVVKKTSGGKEIIVWDKKSC